MSDDKIVRVLRVLEYVGPRDRLYSALDKRHVKSTYTATTLAGEGYIKEILLVEVNDLAGFPLQFNTVEKHLEIEAPSKKSTMHLYRFASRIGGFEIEGSTPEEAWNSLIIREGNDALWVCHDRARNKIAVLEENYKELYSGQLVSYIGPVYKQIK